MMNGYVVVSDSNNDRHLIIVVDRVILTDQQIEQLLNGDIRLRITVNKNVESGYNEYRGTVEVQLPPS